MLCNVPVDVVGLDKLDRAFHSVEDAGDIHRLIGVSDIVDVLLSIYDPMTDHSGALHNVNVPLIVDLVLNWLLNVYDRYD